MKATIDLKGLQHFEIADFSIQSPSIQDIESVNRLIDHEELRINRKRGISRKDSEKWTPLDQVTVLIAPFKIVAIPDRSIYLKDSTPKFPFWYFAVVDRNGNLHIPGETKPVFQRKFLEPLADERTDFIFSSVEKVDLAYTIGKETYQDYADYINNINGSFASAAEQAIEDYQTEGYATIKNGIILLPDEDINAAAGIIQLYEKILKQHSPSPLLTAFTELNSPPERLPSTVPQLIDSNSLHVGQMGADFPLSVSQRKSLYTFLRNESAVFAVNGPPGTGKTTLLQSVVANAVVESAIKGGDPAIILACSTNNQAVTNIIDSFSKSTKENDTTRWLPDIAGYGTYLPANTKSDTELAGVNFKKINGDGLFNKIENRSYISDAKEVYLQKGNAAFGATTLTVEEIISQLQNALKAIQRSLQDSANKWKEYIHEESAFLTNYPSNNSDQSTYYQSGILCEAPFEKDIATLSTLEVALIQYFKTEPFFRKVFCFLGFKAALRNRAADLRILLRGSLLDKDDLADFSRAGLLEKINDTIKMASKIANSIIAWKHWKTQHTITGNPPQSEDEYWKFERIKIEAAKRNDTTLSKPNCFYDELDVTLRHHAFQLAINYWEGRWLLAIESDINSQTFGRKSEQEMKNRWKRQAMITPCFVSTFYMAPRFFSSYKFLQKDDTEKNIYDNPPLFDFLDLLVVDEAGQVSPEVGVATFALARQAIIVGDIKQIEPVWNVSNKVDLGNLKREGLINSYEDLTYEQQYDPKGFLASTGSIMKMSQNSCSYRDPGAKERGVTLLEHRRCYDEIIDYCNILAYNGQLRPLKGKADKSNPFPPMLCIHVEGYSSPYNTSRFNNQEVEAIIRWLLTNKTTIESKYGKIELAVGIITPFTGQKHVLTTKFKKAGFNTDTMKIGTVHALQGAERSIVLFSMVYGPGDSGTMFFDRDNKPNMLNVAVSRAKDSFIVFANTNILKKNARTPSGILSNHLIYNPSNP